MLAGFMPTIAPSHKAALQRRRFLDEVVDLSQRVRYLGSMIGLPLGPGQLDEPLTTEQLADAMRRRHTRPARPALRRALEVAKEGWSLRDVLAHGVIDYHPVVAGTATDLADHMQEWFETGACDGFSIAVDSYHDGLDAFADQVVPILQERVLFHDDYEGPTLRENLGTHEQYSLDPRLTKPARS